MGFFIAIPLWFAAIHICNKRIDLFPASFRNGIRWLRAMSLEFVFVIFTVLMRPLGYLKSHAKPVGPKNGGPILLVHGYLHDSSAWIYIKRSLTKQGFGPIYALNFQHPFQSIRVYAKQVEEKAKEIELATGSKQLTLIGHSMGGLAAAWYATHLAPSKKVSNLITIGSPLKGTYLAHFAIGPNGREMEPKSPFIKELKEALSKAEALRCYHIGTKTDQIIIPSTSAEGYQPEAHLFLVEDIGHATLLFSPRIASQIVSWLRGSL